MGKFSRSGSVCLGFVVLMLSVASCTRERTAPDELVLGINAQPSTLDPRFASDATGMRMVSIIFSSLIKTGAKLQVVPDSAKSWTYKDLTYTMELVPGLTFHNGRAVTAEDVEFSYQQFAGKDSVFSSSFNEVAKFEATNVGDHIQVKIKMKKFVANFLGGDLAVLKILPKQEISGFPKKLIGSGPFELLSKSDNEIVLRRFGKNPLYTPKMPKVVFKVVRDDFTRYQKMMRGELDMVLNDISIEKVPAFEKEPNRFTVFRHPSATMSYVLLNMQDPMLKHLDLRKALSQALNRPEIIHYKLEGLGTEATSILSPAHPYFNSELKNPEYDLSAAKAVIEKLGLTGQKLVFKSSNNPGVIDNAKVLSYQLSQTGLQVDFQSFEWGKFYDDVKRGNFQMATMKWVGISDADIYRNAFHSKEKPPGGRNRSHYNNPAVDAVTEKAVGTEDFENRRNLYLEVQKLVFEDYAILPLWYEVQVAIMKKSVNGFEPSILGGYETLVNVHKDETGPSAGSPLAGQRESVTSVDSRN